METKWITPKEVSDYLNKSLSFVYRHAKELNGAKMGHTIFFTREGVDDAILSKIKGSMDRNCQCREKDDDQGVSDKVSGNRMGGRGKEELRETGRWECFNRVGLAEFCD